jgi:hypothetical protein
VTVAAGAAVTVLAPSFAQVLDLRGIVLVPVAELFLDLVVVWRRGDRSLAVHRFLAAADTATAPTPHQADASSDRMRSSVR